ncbi:MAG: tRNA 2-thiouridine(34) synthase MnmA [Candidatus Tectomicrobia bacterium]|uniref:tRNA-specific 2-thiouridylase MnmA n=1 Tax=Tectimicrobiota bacterium TaxID=2528274 RepID=A0A932CMY5_UNCTE|nr:tRNA 2-thiouridine(34) synthase MnmA [Candidatus Tectomicrobia bacterium]
MSGGVDSSVAAALLKGQGHEVIGVTMRLPSYSTGGERSRTCCSLEDIADARRVAQKLGLPFYVKDCEREFEAGVIDYFTAEYLAGRTPNPCIPCNQRLKFHVLWSWARELGASRLATGHYARLAQLSPGGRTMIRRGADPAKDQSYFLFNLTQEQLQGALFPLGDYTKEAVRGMAQELSLPVAHKAESQEICFIPDRSYAAFLQGRVPPEAIRPGPILNRQGQVLGQHRGLPFYTIGQRKGLGLSSPEPLYVIDLLPEQNALIVGGREELARDVFGVEQVTWSAFSEPPPTLKASVQIRYRHPGAEATIMPLAGDRAWVTFEQPQRAITPGQAAVFYQGDLLLGGGWITKAVCSGTPTLPR